MKKLLLLSLLFASVAGMAQSKTETGAQPLMNWPLTEASSQSMHLNMYVEPIYKDTVNCLIHVIGKKGFTDAWITAKAIVKDGLYNENTKTYWLKAYMGIATGPFNNKFITDFDITNCYVIQVAFTEKLTK